MVIKLSLLAKTMSENKSSKTDAFYSWFQAVIYIGMPVGSYFILDWGILQILGAIFVMLMAFVIYENKLIKTKICKAWSSFAEEIEPGVI